MDHRYHPVGARVNQRPVILVWALITCLLVSLPARSAFADVMVTELAASRHLSLEWDPFRRIGIIHNGIDRILFDPVRGSLVLNYSELVLQGAVAYRGDTVMFSDEAAAFVREFFADTGSIPGARVAAIVIDPGHGGRDPGASHSHEFDGESVNLVEKNIVLGIAKDLYDMLLVRYPSRELVITRKADDYPSLEERVEMANAVEIDPIDEIMIFVSIHANASINAKTFGYEVWYLPPEYERKGLVDTKDVGEEAGDVLQILNLMRDDEYTTESIRLAQSILDGFDRTVGEESKNLGLKEEIWFVVRNAKMPSILVELGFLTNPYEAKLMTQDDYLRKLTMGLFDGISRYVDGFESRYALTSLIE
jgi:N-acetylmuramoyl-L-alanine amidase